MKEEESDCWAKGWSKIAARAISNTLSSCFAFVIAGFLKIEYIEKPEFLTFRPVGDTRYDMSMRAMAEYAEDQVRQLEEIKKEMERKAKEDERKAVE